MNDRLIKIMDILSTGRKIKISLLAEILDVSNLTLRKDLDKLEKRGIINRHHGYACLDGANDTGKRIAINHSVKKRIARSAADIVKEGETVFIESGSCCALLAEEMVLANNKINIVTNSTFIAYYIKGQNVKITLLGGFFQPESQVLIGPITKKCAEHIYSQKFFIGTDGFIPDYGFTTQDYFHAETIADLTKYAKEVYIITESSKFDQRGACNLLKFDKITGVFTDDGISKKAEDALVKNKVTVYKVPAAEENLKWNRFSDLPPVLYKENE